MIGKRINISVRRFLQKTENQPRVFLNLFEYRNYGKKKTHHATQYSRNKLNVRYFEDFIKFQTKFFIDFFLRFPCFFSKSNIEYFDFQKTSCFFGLLKNRLTLIDMYAGKL